MTGKFVLGWRVLTLGAVAAVAVVVAAGYGYAAITASDPVYTGCLKGGALSNVAVGTAPFKNCGKNAAQISWNQTGPQGLPGPTGATGATGATGPKGDGGSLSGAPCTRTDGAAGNMTTRVTREDLIVVSCETASGNQTLPFNDEVADEAVISLIGSGTHDVTITPNCNGGFQVGCSGGQAVDPPSTLQFTALDNYAAQVPASSHYNAGAYVSVRSVQPIPVTVAGVQCSLNIQTTLNEAVPMTAQLVWHRFANASAPSNISFQSVFVSFDVNDYSLSGSFACSAISTQAGVVQDFIESTLTDQGPLCGAPGPELFMRCTS